VARWQFWTEGKEGERKAFIVENLNQYGRSASFVTLFLKTTTN
jgi:hypothetical protein